MPSEEVFQEKQNNEDNDELKLLLEPKDQNIFKFQYKNESSFNFCACLFACWFTIIHLPLIIILSISYIVSLCFWNEIGTKFAYRYTSFNKSLVQALMNNVGHYIPPWWYNAHFCIFSFGKSPNLIFDREIYIHPDGTRFAVDWYPHAPQNHFKNNSDENLIALYLPGLGISSDHNAAQVFAQIMSENTIESRQIITGILVPRGHPTSELPWTTPKPWHAACTEDLKLVLSRLYNLPFASKVFLSGYSASSNILAMTLSDLAESEKLYYFEKNSNLEIIGSMLVAANYDYTECKDKLESSFLGNIYSRLFVFQFKTFLHANKHMHKSIENIEDILNCSLISEYDTLTYRTNGFKSLQNMHDRLTPKLILPNINIPVLTMVSSDDPLYTLSYGSVQDGINLRDYTDNENIIFIEPSHGTHLGYFEGSVFEMFTNNLSYRYPAHVALEMIKFIIDNKKIEAEINFSDNKEFVIKKFLMKDTNIEIDHNDTPTEPDDADHEIIL